MMQIYIRKAAPSDAQILTRISFAAKRVWKYPEEYFSIWKNELTITPEYIEKNMVVAAVIGNAVIGYYSVVHNDRDRTFGNVFVEQGDWMEHLFIDPPFIGKGIGRELTDDMKSRCRLGGISELFVFVDPNAEGFYRKIGAQFLRRSQSNIPNREIPVYVIHLR